MNKILKWPVLLACSLVLAAGPASCSDDDAPADNLAESAKEQALKRAVEPFVSHTVIPTYRGMADAALELYKKCQTILDHFDAGTLTEADIASAGQSWNEARSYWELSEAFLFGAATDYNIDPHIDSWPLDKVSMDAMLGNEGQMAQMSPEYVSNNLGYGLLGFHAVEYLLFELSADGQQSQTHSTSYTRQQLVYLTAVAGDLSLQCTRLEASWAGLEGVTAEKQQMLADAELEPTRNYGESMLHAGQGGSLYKNYQDAAEEIIQGCIDIADEVGAQKIGRPNGAASQEDVNYIESPYSLNSIVDFRDNIVSIRNAYEGSRADDASISDYIRSVNPDLDTRVSQAIEASIQAIEAIPEPFAQTATGPEATRAIEVIAELSRTLSEVSTQLAK